MKRTLAVVALAVFFSAVTTEVATTRPARGCPKARPVTPEAESPRADEVPELPVRKVTDSATAKKPLVVQYDHGPALWWWYAAPMVGSDRGPVIDDNRYFNFQIETRKKLAGLHMRLTWPAPAPDEFDIYLFSGGSMVAWSEGFNQVPPGARDPRAGWGLEYINGVPVVDCEVLTLESMAMWTAGKPMTLEVWLGPIEWEG